MQSILGVAAATALPSEVWPFRKIFLPTFDLVEPEFVGLSRLPYPGPLTEARVSAAELEAFAKQIPDLFFAKRRLYELLNKESNMSDIRLAKSEPVFRDGIWHAKRGLFT